MRFLRFLFIAIGLIACTCLCRADTWRRADIFFIDWDVLTRSALSPERVRELADYKRTFKREAPEIARSLAIEKLKPVKDNYQEDVRLVVDLFSDTGARVTYYASRFNLCSADGTLRRPIDEKFRRHFKRLVR